MTTTIYDHNLASALDIGDFDRLDKLLNDATREAHEQNKKLHTIKVKESLRIREAKETLHRQNSQDDLKDIVDSIVQAKRWNNLITFTYIEHISCNTCKYEIYRIQGNYQIQENTKFTSKRMILLPASTQTEAAYTYTKKVDICGNCLEITKKLSDLEVITYDALLEALK